MRFVGPEEGERKGLHREFHGYRVGRGKLMNGGDLVGVNKRAPGSGNRCTRGSPLLSFLELCVADRKTVREIVRLLNPRFSVFQKYHVASRQHPLGRTLLMNALNLLNSADDGAVHKPSSVRK